MEIGVALGEADGDTVGVEIGVALGEADGVAAKALEKSDLKIWATGVGDGETLIP